MASWRRHGRLDDYEYYHRHHRHRNRRHATVTGFCLIAAFVLFLFVALSLPIMKSVYLLQFNGRTASNVPATSVGTELRFGVWGFCVTSVLNKPTLFTNTGRCLGPQLGYTIDPEIIRAVTNEPDLANLILKSITVLLVLHPIAAGLAFLTLLPVIASCCVFHAAPWNFSLVLSVATAIVSSIVFAADLALVIVARHKLKNDSAFNVTLSFGNGVWMVLVGMLFTWVAMILLSARICGCCGLGR
ncbi:actin cortical patch SUR7/pH-response regulator pali [Lactifluus subvellereus]|nr:actin cortical patch SUR7/pH-response regulator pali [Lactifluus subvellereus]